jgi:hypothetical protein
MNYIIEFNIMHPICQTSSGFSAEMRPPAYSRAAVVSVDAEDTPHDIPVLGVILPTIYH